MSGHTPKMTVSLWKKPWGWSASKKSTSCFTFSLWYCKDIVKLLFWVLWACLAKHTHSDTINLYKTCVYLQIKNSSPILFWWYWKNMQTYFGYFGYAWFHTPKMIVPTCRQLWCLSSCQKYTSSFTSFLRYYLLKNPVIWLPGSILAHNSRLRILPDIGLMVKYQ